MVTLYAMSIFPDTLYDELQARHIDSEGDDEGTLFVPRCPEAEQLCRVYGMPYTVAADYLGHALLVVPYAYHPALVRRFRNTKNR